MNKAIKYRAYPNEEQLHKIWTYFTEKTEPNELVLGKAGIGKSFNLNAEKMSSSILLEHQSKANIYCDPKNEVLIDE